jgi:hypothetical protein
LETKYSGKYYRFIEVTPRYEKSYNEILSAEGLYEPTPADVYWTKKKADMTARGKPPTKKHEGKKKSRRK